LSFHISPEIEAVAMRLLRIRHVESLLIARLVPPNEDEPAHIGMGVDGQGTEIGSSWRRNEVCVRSGTGWKRVLARAMRVPRSENNSAESEEGRPPGSTNDAETHDEPQEVLNACKHDMMKLWYDPSVREILRRKKIRLEELPGL
jgi:guanine nucleotide-binding protein subunit alpha